MLIDGIKEDKMFLSGYSLLCKYINILSGGLTLLEKVSLRPIEINSDTVGIL